ncbi:hypothetical protein Ahy_B06g079786 isoform F [Arachis hypogaea]|uniref:Uncharacterized protein n=1 Tax=Arachis hypogaea TaxID=3818 RepID=A0A444YG75_ARAHY|nr:hypothetical protein Ahy_B06g079786 isoform F [Arachis hypogaea]
MKRAVRAGSDFFHCGCGCCGRFCALMSLLVLAELNFVVFGVGGDIRTLVPSKFEAEDDRNAILIFFLSLLLLLSGSGQQATATSDISNLISSSIIFISLASCFLPYFAPSFSWVSATAPKQTNAQRSSPSSPVTNLLYPQILPLLSLSLLPTSFPNANFFCSLFDRMRCHGNNALERLYE